MDSINNISVKYNGQEPWATAGSNNAPYVGMAFEAVNFGGHWANIRTITLSGSVSGGLTGNKMLETVKNDIINTFKLNGKTFEFVSSEGGTMTFDNVFVESVSFPQQSYIGDNHRGMGTIYAGKLDYSVSLKVYDFQGAAILEPKDDVQAEVAPDKTITITHSVSAQGVDDAGGNGMENAKAWVVSRIANIPHNMTEFLSVSEYVILDDSEVFNRLTSTYSRVRKYFVDGLSGSPFLQEVFVTKRYNVIVNSSIEADFTSIEITAEYKGGKNTTSAQLTDIDFESDLLSKADSIYDNPPGFSGANLHTVPNSLSIDEDMNNKMVTVKASFEENDCYTCIGVCKEYFDYETSVSTDYISGVTTVDVDGELIIKGTLKERNIVIDGWLTTRNVKTFLSSYASGAYNLTADPSGTYPYNIYDAGLNGQATSFTVTRNETKGTLRLSASYSDEDGLNNSAPAGFGMGDFGSADWNCSIVTSIPVVKSAPSATVNGHYSAQHLGFNSRVKASVTVNVSAREDEATATGTDLRGHATVLVRGAGVGSNPFDVVGTDPFGQVSPTGASPPQHHVTSSSEDQRQEAFETYSITEERSYESDAPLISGFNILQ